MSITVNRKDQCSICYEDLSENVIILALCNHAFHHSCIAGWIKDHRNCPLCRELAGRCSIVDSNGVKRPLTYAEKAEHLDLFAEESRKSGYPVAEFVCAVAKSCGYRFQHELIPVINEFKSLILKKSASVEEKNCVAIDRSNLNTIYMKSDEEQFSQSHTQLKEVPSREALDLAQAFPVKKEKTLQLKYLDLVGIEKFGDVPLSRQSTDDKKEAGENQFVPLLPAPNLKSEKLGKLGKNSNTTNERVVQLKITCNEKNKSLENEVHDLNFNKSSKVSQCKKNNIKWIVTLLGQSTGNLTSIYGLLFKKNFLFNSLNKDRGDAKKKGDSQNEKKILELAEQIRESKKIEIAVNKQLASFDQTLSDFRRSLSYSNELIQKIGVNEQINNEIIKERAKRIREDEQRIIEIGEDIARNKKEIEESAKRMREDRQKIIESRESIAKSKREIEESAKRMREDKQKLINIEATQKIGTNAIVIPLIVCIFFSIYYQANQS